jgi:hypothetical protein
LLDFRTVVALTGYFGTSIRTVVATPFTAVLASVLSVLATYPPCFAPITPAALPKIAAAIALLAALFTTLLARFAAIATITLGAFLPVAGLRLGFGGQGGDGHRRGEDA